MSQKSKELQEALLHYATEVLTDIHKVITFCDDSANWLLNRESELDAMSDLADQAKKSRQSASLDSKLSDVLKDVLLGLNKLHPFLETVEKLAVTSLHVFSGNSMLRLPPGIELNSVQVLVLVAKHLAPVVLKGKIDTERFFEAKLYNVEALALQLNTFILITSKICERFNASISDDFTLRMVKKTAVKLDESLSEDEIQKMLDHITQLTETRTDPKFRTAYLFQQKHGQSFITEFDQRLPEILQFMNVLEEVATQLDRMNMGARISGVAGGTVGLTGGILSIVGLALTPFTLGASLALTFTGMGLGIATGINSLVTTSTEIAVKKTQEKKANEVYQHFMEGFQSLQECIDEVANPVIVALEESAPEVENSLPVASSAAKLLNTGRVASSLSVLADIPDIGQAAAKTSVAMSSAARAGFITLNALFIGFDVFFICKDGFSLYKGSETDASRFIRARSALWGSVMDSWQDLRNALEEGLPTLEKKEAVLETPFYPESIAEKAEGTKEENTNVPKGLQAI